MQEQVRKRNYITTQNVLQHKNYRVLEFPTAGNPQLVSMSAAHLLHKETFLFASH